MCICYSKLKGKYHYNRMLVHYTDLHDSYCGATDIFRFSVSKSAASNRRQFAKNQESLNTNHKTVYSKQNHIRSFL